MTFDYIKFFRKLKWYKKTFHLLVWISLFSLLAPQNFATPVKGSTKSDYHPDSFWFYPWGKSGTHKGVDIFARKETSVVASTH